MNKKGFTLTELIAILVIISIVALIAVPAVVNSIKNNNHDSYNGVVNDIILASETYAANMGASIVQISVETLKQAGYLPADLKNPIDNSNFNGCVYVVDGDPIYKEETCSTIILNVHGVRLYRDSILNGLDPVLDTGLIPVTIADDGTVTKASLGSEWYNYAQKKWANAVILKDSDNYLEGQIIPESDIESYFVWIPKFKYKLFDIGNYTNVTNSKPSSLIGHTIDIVFDPVNTTDSETSCATPLTSGTSGNCAVGKYMTHPSFITLGVNGYWVGKFEVSGTTSSLEVKPNANSLRNVTVGSFFTSIYDYNRNLESHMIKNTEWGAVTYLSLSNYGVNGEVRINNSSQYITGCSGTVAANNYSSKSQSDHTEGYYAGCENAYNTATGYLASTTGNITGVYDLSGSAWEFTAAYVSGNVGSSGLNVSGYNNKYFDIYSTSSSYEAFNYRILGDATGEMGPYYYYADSDSTSRVHNNWFADYSAFVEPANPWFARGGDFYNGVVAGPLNFGKSSGASGGTTRIVLAPQAKEEIDDVYINPLGAIWSFDYTGSVQTFSVPESGTYKLEVWGAAGGQYVSYLPPGLGGYSVGSIDLNQGDKLYIVVGGSGHDAQDTSGASGGYNGGGNGGSSKTPSGVDPYKGGGGGGGATHIATSNLGELKNYENNKNDVVIVAGGGGGSSSWSLGGSGGGTQGNKSQTDFPGFCTSTILSVNGGTQNSGYAFGQGQNAHNRLSGTDCGCEGIGGGGGGWYGGSAYQSDGVGTAISGAGGSGYVGNSNLYNKKMVSHYASHYGVVDDYTESTECHNGIPTTDCAKEGNGYVKITLLSH